MATLTYYGRLADDAGAFQESVRLPDEVRDVDGLRAWAQSVRGLRLDAGGRAVRIAVNDEIVRGNAPVRDSDDIAFLPPVGGG